MKYRDLQLQTQREAPNNARTRGFAFLVRAGYRTRENLSTPLGETALNHLRDLSNDASFFPDLSLPMIGNEHETFFPIASGDIEVAHCTSCKYTERFDLGRFEKPAEATHESLLPIEKIPTPDCNTIESLAIFLNIPKKKTAKALMYTRIKDGKFIFVVIRGDLQSSEAKLKMHLGEIRPATVEEIVSAGAAAGYASAVGLKDALIVVDDLIPHSPNLVAGANEAGYHLRNTNYGRDYSAEIVADLIQVNEGDTCINCRNPLSVFPVIRLASRTGVEFENILLALAEAHHDDKGLTLPHPTAPFDVYLMHLPGKELDTLASGEEIYNAVQSAGISILFDDRAERAGVKFNDADLIGCPIRVTVGEKGLRDGSVEVRQRKGKEDQLVPINDIIPMLKSMLQ